MTTYRRRKDSDTWHWCKKCRYYPNNPDDIKVRKAGKERPSYGELDNNCLRLEKEKKCKRR